MQNIQQVVSKCTSNKSKEDLCERNNQRKGGPPISAKIISASIFITTVGRNAIIVISTSLLAYLLPANTFVLTGMMQIVYEDIFSKLRVYAIIF